MTDLERALLTLAERGTVRGVDQLIEDFEAKLAESALPAATPEPSRAPTPSWSRGLSVAVAVFALILLGVGGLVLAGLAGGDRDPAVDSPVTSIPVISSEDAFDGVAIAGNNAVGIVAGEQLVAMATDVCCATAVHDDLMGGLVFQQADGPVLWLAVGAESPVELAAADGGETLLLEGVSAIEGAPSAVMLRTTVDGQASVVAVRLLLGDEEEIFVVAERPITVDRVSHAGGTYLVSFRSGTETWFEFRDEAGELGDVSINPRAIAGDSEVGQAVLAPDGRSMVYIERPPEAVDGGLGDLVTFDSVDGRELSRHRITSLGGRIVSFDGIRLVVLRQRADPSAPPLMLAINLVEREVFTEGGVGPLGS